MRPSIKIALGILTALSVMAFIVCWEFFIKERIDSAEVVVVKAGETIEKKDQITRDHLTIERRARKDLVEGVVFADQMKEVIGEDAAQVIVGNSMISTQMIDFDDLIPDESKGEAIRPIMSEWILTAPGSLRRKDRIDIYAIDRKVIEALDGQTSINKEGDVVVVKDEEEGEVNLEYLEPILTDVPVLYVKDNSNREVITQNEGNARLDGSSNVGDLELLLNEEDFKKLANSVLKDKTQLYITYN